MGQLGLIKTTTQIPQSSESVTSVFPVHPDARWVGGGSWIGGLSGVLRDQRDFLPVHIYSKYAPSSPRESQAVPPKVVPRPLTRGASFSCCPIMWPLPSQQGGRRGGVTAMFSFSAAFCTSSELSPLFTNLE